MQQTESNFNSNIDENSSRHLPFKTNITQSCILLEQFILVEPFFSSVQGTRLLFAVVMMLKATEFIEMCSFSELSTICKKNYLLKVYKSERISHCACDEFRIAASTWIITWRLGTFNTQKEGTFEGTSL